MKRFWDKVEKTNYCWNWTAGKDDFGYGQFRYEDKNTKAHRVSFHLTHGRYPVLTRHKCDNPGCVNPDHLIEGDSASNNKDIADRDRHKWSVTNAQATDIRKMVYDDTIIARVMADYNVTDDTARNILTGNTFSHILPAGKPVPRQKSKRKLSEAAVQEIRQDLKNRYWGQMSILAQRHNVSRNIIERIRDNKY